jgi:beta-galactosidase/beta-glucuronidase
MPVAVSICVANPRPGKPVSFNQKTKLHLQDSPINLTTIIQNANGREVARATEKQVARQNSHAEISQKLVVSSPILWSDERPYLYKIVTQLEQGGRIVEKNKSGRANEVRPR